MKHNLRCAMAAALLFVFASLCYIGGVLDSTDHLMADTLYGSYREINPNIFVIGIDGDTLDHYGSWGTWSRETVAELVSYLNEDENSKPAVIGLDIMFTGNTTDRADKSLVEAVRSGGNVVVASQVFFSPLSISENNGEMTNQFGIQKYETAFEDLSGAADSGLINVFPDSDGVVRNGIYQLPYNGQELYSFSAQIAKAYAAQTNSQLTPPKLNRNQEWYIPFAGKPGDFYGTGTSGTSWIRVMNQEIPRELFADGIVLIGPYTTGMMDHYYTSADRRVPMYGLEIHANMVQCLLEGYYKLSLPGYLAIITTLIFSAGIVIAFCKLSLKKWTLVSVLIALGYLGISWFSYGQGWVFPIFYPMLSFVLIYLTLLITNSVMLTVEKANLYDQLHQLFVNSIKTIANAIDAKDPCTSGHCQRVAEYSLILGKALDFNQQDLTDLEYAALLHDVGKIGISDGVLKKDGPLTDEEYAEIKTHPLLGARILTEIKEFRGRITEGAKYHHERYDGRGYCEGLAGPDIPLFGRIIAIADSYDAMTQNRPYHRRMSQDKALDEIRKNMGTQFDPDLGKIFMELMIKLPPPEEGKPIIFSNIKRYE